MPLFCRVRLQIFRPMPLFRNFLEVCLMTRKLSNIQVWTNAGDAVQWVMPVDSAKQFFRVRSDPGE